MESCNCAGDVGLEIAPGNDVEDLSLIEDVGNAWNSIPQAREWTALDPKYAACMSRSGPAACKILHCLRDSTACA